MRKIAKPTVLACMASLMMSPAAHSQKSDLGIVFRNPSNSVHVRIHKCGTGRCGTVVWANDKAKADSARGGTRNLIGTELFREFREISPQVWKGKIFVPDLNRVFAGTGTLKDQNTIVARGCLFAGIGCKSQTWTRVR